MPRDWLSEWGKCINKMINSARPQIIAALHKSQEEAIVLKLVLQILA